MTAEEFLVPDAFCERRFILETYSVRHMPYTPALTSIREDIMLRRAGIMRGVNS